jgi:hypothetical protein
LRWSGALWRWDLVVTDVVTGRQVARTTVAGRFTWGGWEAPPVSMLGTTMWAHFDDGWTAYDWASGTVSKVPGSTAASESAHGRFATRGATTWTVHDFTDGSTVREPECGPRCAQRRGLLYQWEPFSNI